MQQEFSEQDWFLEDVGIKKEKEKNEEALTIYITTEDKIFNDLISKYKEDLSKKREYKIELNETYDISKMTKENNKMNIEEVYENELKIIEMLVKSREENRKIYLNLLDKKKNEKPNFNFNSCRKKQF